MSPLRVLILDDEPYRVTAFTEHLHGARIVHTPSVPEAWRQLVAKHWDVVFLDHDLELSGENYGTDAQGDGSDLVNLIAQHPKRFTGTLFIVHSLNPERGPWMVRRLKKAGLQVRRRAHAWTDKGDLRALARDRVWPREERWCLLGLDMALSA